MHEKVRTLWMMAVDSHVMDRSKTWSANIVRNADIAKVLLTEPHGIQIEDGKTYLDFSAPGVITAQPVHAALSLAEYSRFINQPTILAFDSNDVIIGYVGIFKRRPLLNTETDDRGRWLAPAAA